MSTNPILLAFDTATEYCSVALSTHGQTLSRTEKLGNSHSECLLPWISDLVKKSGIELQNIDGILFSAGPGSFTGLRIACGVAQGLGYGLDKKLLPTSTLTAIAHHYRNRASKVAVLNDARMNECYAAIYENGPEGFKQLTEEQLIKPSEVNDWLCDHDVKLAVGTAIGVYEMGLTVENEYCHPDAQYMIEWYRDCGASLQSLWTDPDKAAPLYVRDHVALTIDERSKGEKL